MKMPSKFNCIRYISAGVSVSHQILLCFMYVLMTSAQFILFSHMVLTVFVFVFVFLCQNQYFLFLSLLICLSLPSFRLTERLSLSTLPADLSEGRFFCFSRRSARVKKNLARKRVLLYFSLARQMILCCATHIYLSSPCSAVNSFFLAFQKKM